MKQKKSAMVVCDLYMYLYDLCMCTKAILLFTSVTVKVVDIYLHLGK